MKRFMGILALLFFFNISAQSNSELLAHYKAYYEQMKSQGDVQGVINALTHLNILDKNQERTDTLAVLYMNAGQHIQALNTIGIELDPNDSDMAVEVKAVCLQELNQIDRAIEQFEELFKRAPSALIAYELADLKTQKDRLAEAQTHISYGIANSPEGVMRTFYESQVPYQVPIKAAFLYMKGLVTFRENPDANIDKAISIFDEALAMAPEFNLAKLSKDALQNQKNNKTKN